MKPKDFVKRTWLYPADFGRDNFVIVRYYDSEAELILSDCTSNVRLHSYLGDRKTKAQIKKKMKKFILVRDHLDELIKEVYRRHGID